VLFTLFVLEAVSAVVMVIGWPALVVDILVAWGGAGFPMRAE
jgi:hypothetical protein